MSIKPRPTDGVHKVSDGEWIGSIAAMFGVYDWERIWKAPVNADLAKRRDDNPRCLADGDEVFIPPFDDSEESGDTEQRHRFKLKTSHELLRIRLLDDDGEPLENEPYTLEIDSKPGSPVFVQQNKQTNGEGMLEEKIPLGALSGKLTLPDQEQQIDLRLGYLTPLDLNDKKLLIRGTQERLRALGFDPGRIDGINGPSTEDAVASFQEFCEKNAGGSDSSIINAGPIDGIVGPKTVKALLSHYGC